MAVEIFQITKNDGPTIERITGLHEAYFIGHLGWESSFAEDIGNYLGGPLKHFMRQKPYTLAMDLKLLTKENMKKTL